MPEVRVIGLAMCDEEDKAASMRRKSRSTSEKPVFAKKAIVNPTCW